MPAQSLSHAASARDAGSIAPSANESSHLPMHLAELASEHGGNRRSASDATQALRVEFGRLTHVASVEEGSVITFPHDNSQEVAIFLGNQLVAHGTLVAADGRVGVRLSEIVAQSQNAEAA